LRRFDFQAFFLSLTIFNEVKIMEAFLMEKMNMKSVGLGDGHALTGDRISMKDAKRVSFGILVGTGNTETAFAVTLRQHDAASAGVSKDLSVANKYFTKINLATAFTAVEPTVAAAAYDLHADFGDNVGMVVFEVLAEDLDHVNGFGWVSADISGAGVTTRTVGVCGIIDDNHKPSYGNVI
jgi:hypothetical protein